MNCNPYLILYTKNSSQITEDLAVRTQAVRLLRWKHGKFLDCGLGDRFPGSTLTKGTSSRTKDKLDINKM